MALAYPRALFYPLLMTKASAAAKNGAGGAGADDDGRRLSRLTALTADPTAEAFAEVIGLNSLAYIHRGDRREEPCIYTVGCA